QRGLVLPVPVQHDDKVRPLLQRRQVARRLVATVADVVRVPDDLDGQAARDCDGRVGRLVVDEDDVVGPPFRDRGNRGGERAGRVEGGHDDGDPDVLATTRLPSTHAGTLPVCADVPR